MALDLKHAAIHESAHAVLLWLVGWGSDLERIQMRLVNGGAEDPAMKADLPPPTDPSVLRSTLLVLFAGSAASTAHFGKCMKDIDKDWHKAAGAVAIHYHSTRLEALLPPRIGFKDPEINSLVQRAIEQAGKIVCNTSVKAAINAVAELVLKATPNQDGLCIVPGTEIIAVCEQILGTMTQQDNPCGNWIAGE